MTNKSASRSRCTVAKYVVFSTLAVALVLGLTFKSLSPSSLPGRTSISEESVQVSSSTDRISFIAMESDETYEFIGPRSQFKNASSNSPEFNVSGGEMIASAPLRRLRTLGFSNEANQIELPSKEECQPIYEYILRNQNHTDAWRSTLPPLKPIWTPAFPGSGSAMFKDFIRTITGMEAEHNCTRSVDWIVTCKTHFPTLLDRNIDEWRQNETIRALYAPEAFIIIRNPLKSIPSWCNQAWETRNQIQSHTQKAPQEDWRVWRNRRALHEIQRWGELISKWFTGLGIPVTQVIQYERITDPATGPSLLARVVDRIEKLQGVKLSLNELRGKDAKDIDSKRKVIPCLWREVVLDRPGKKRAWQNYTPGFTVEMKEQLLAMYDHLLDMGGLSKQTELLELVQEYREDMLSNIVIDEEL